MPPNFLIYSLILLALVGVSAYAYGWVSIPTITTSILTYPALVPFITTYIYGVPHFTPLASEYEAVWVANKVLLYVTVFLGVGHAVYWLFSNRERPSTDVQLPEYRLPVDKVGVAAVSLVFLVAAYLQAPGPTIFEMGYHDQPRYEWATFAGSVYKGAWAVLFALTVRKSSKRPQYWWLLAISTTGIMWLYLHGRRVESIGIVILLYADYLWNRRDLTVTDILRSRDIGGLVASFGFGTYVVLIGLIGRIRKSIATAGGASGSASGSAAGSAASEQAVSSLNYGDGFVGVPGGGHGTYGTMQATMHVFPRDVDYLYGETFVSYIPQMIPTPILQLIGYEPPPMYHALLESLYAHNGGNYVLNVYYANFGPVGVITAGVLLGLLLTGLHRVLREQQPLPSVTTAIAAVVFINFLRAVWYTQLNWVDSIQGVFAVLVFYLAVVRVTDWCRGSLLPSNHSSVR